MMKAIWLALTKSQLVCFYLSFLILWTDQFFALFLPALTITCYSKMIGKLQELKKKCKILPYSSEVFAPRYFRFIVWNENFGKICSRQTCIMWTPFGQFVCVWYDICLHKTYNFVLPPDTKFRKRYPRFFLVIWWKRYLFKFTSFRTPTLEIIIWINIYVVLFDR